ncbi:Glycosyl_transferase family 2 protein [Hexamita inflata]|uniref:Glycosyl transferase family 2 protein n=1 Tax=Hexamita inflata TaxID=28002 RepID=A0AA86TY12_9EUKA|nr:Glycosyl transferase family 2 protein [Hexamita inflata]
MLIISIICENVPNISIIIPLYNQAQFLTEAVRSIESQSFQNYEIIVIDDLSTDNAQEVIQQLKQQNDRIYNIQFAENQGPFLARTKGIVSARGKYVLFVDADDFLNSGTILQHAFDLAEDQSADIVHFNEKLLESSGESAFTWANPLNDSVQGKYFGLTQWIISGQGTALHGKLLLRNQLLRALVLIENNYQSIFTTKLYFCEDILLMTAFYVLQEKYVPLLEFGYTYTVRPNSLSKSSQQQYEKFIKRADNSLIVYQIIKQMLAGLDHEYQRNIHYQFFKYMKSFIQEIYKYFQNNAEKRAFICDKFINSNILMEEFQNKLKTELCEAIKQ